MVTKKSEVHLFEVKVQNLMTTTTTASLIGRFDYAQAGVHFCSYLNAIVYFNCLYVVMETTVGGFCYC